MAYMKTHDVSRRGSGSCNPTNRLSRVTHGRIDASDKSWFNQNPRRLPTVGVLLERTYVTKCALDWRLKGVITSTRLFHEFPAIWSTSTCRHLFSIRPSVLNTHLQCLVFPGKGQPYCGSIVGWFLASMPTWCFYRVSSSAILSDLWLLQPCLG